MPGGTLLPSLLRRPRVVHDGGSRLGARVAGNGLLGRCGGELLGLTLFGNSFDLDALLKLALEKRWPRLVDDVTSRATLVVYLVDLRSVECAVQVVLVVADVV